MGDKGTLLLAQSLCAGYGLAFVSGLLGLFRRGNALQALGTWLPRLTLLLHGALLALRWRQAGGWIPPWGSAFDALALASFTLVGAQQYGTFKYRNADQVSGLGVFTVATAFCAAAWAWLLLKGGAGTGAMEPLLRSPWLAVHALSGMIAYGFFLLAAFVSVSYLIQSGLRTDALQAWMSGALFIGLSVWEGPALVFGEPLTVAAAGLLGVHAFFAAGVSLFQVRGGRSSGRMHPWLELLCDDEEKIGWGRFALRVVFLAGIAAMAARLVARAAGGIAPDGFAAYFAQSLLLLFSLPLAALIRWRSVAEGKLPAPERLERRAYRAILLGTAWMSLNLLSGGAWALAAWGSPWSWDPKQVWALAVWVVFGIYLHQKRDIPAGESETVRGRRLAWIAILGAATVLFAFLGVGLGAGKSLPTEHGFLGFKEGAQVGR